MQTAFASAERVFSIIDTKSNIIEVSNPIKINELKNRIEFDNVSFKYEDSSINILRNISGSNPAFFVNVIPSDNDNASIAICKFIASFIECAVPVSPK